MSKFNIEKKLIKLKQSEHRELKKLKVAAYCRVSTYNEEQLNSFESQVKVYTKMIKDNQEWKLAGIYADEGVTGTSIAKRAEFQRMMKDCEKGKIDLILTKSISRFARNTLECLSYVRHLQSLGVNIIFENNNIDTRTAFSEMLLTVLAAFAQEESRSISENTIWSIRKRFEEGVTRWCRLFGYTKNENGEYQIVPDEEKVVKTVFQLYEHGEPIKKIAEYLNENGITASSGNKWVPSVVHTLLRNERYMGDILLQKFRVENHLTHKCLRNDCTEIPSFYIEDHHTPIISREQFERCRKIMLMRRSTKTVGNKNIRECDQYPLMGRLKCPYCGSLLYQRTIKVQKTSAAWCCEQGENACHRFIIRSSMVNNALIEAYNRLDIQNTSDIALEIKKQYPILERADFWWIDDMIDHIELGTHNLSERERKQMEARGEEYVDDRTLTVFWKCGAVTTVSSGVKEDINNPAHIAELLRKSAIRAEKRRGAKRK